MTRYAYGDRVEVLFGQRWVPGTIVRHYRDYAMTELDIEGADEPIPYYVHVTNIKETQ